MKLDENGNYQWGLRIGGTYDDEIQSVIETSQGNYVITGKYYSSPLISMIEQEQKLKEQ